MSNYHINIIIIIWNKRMAQISYVSYEKLWRMKTILTPAGSFCNIIVTSKRQEMLKEFNTIIEKVFIEKIKKISRKENNTQNKVCFLANR